MSNHHRDDRCLDHPCIQLRIACPRKIYSATDVPVRMLLCTIPCTLVFSMLIQGSNQNCEQHGCISPLHVESAFTFRHELWCVLLRWMVWSRTISWFDRVRHCTRRTDRRGPRRRRASAGTCARGPCFAAVLPTLQYVRKVRTSAGRRCEWRQAMGNVWTNPRQKHDGRSCWDRWNTPCCANKAPNQQALVNTTSSTKKAPTCAVDAARRCTNQLPSSTADVVGLRSTTTSMGKWNDVWITVLG